MIEYVIVAWLFFSLGMAFSQTKKGKQVIMQIGVMLDQAGIKNKKEEKYEFD